MPRDDFQLNPPRRFGDISTADYQRWYGPPATTPHTFEIGLVMAGAVSAGAYTAGVLDYLFESLDRWYQERQLHDLPTHQVKLRVMSGSSAGGINAALAAAAAPYGFAPVDSDMSSYGSSNPFFDPWVNRIDIRHLLDNADIQRGDTLSALLNCDVLEHIADQAMGFRGNPLESGQRDWLEDPFQVRLTYTNLQGVPYWVRFQGETALPHEMHLHQDYLSFGVPVHGEIPADYHPPDTITLPLRRDPNDRAWASLGQTALATAAFPLALQPRQIWRSPSDYEYRFGYLQDHSPIYAQPWPQGAKYPQRAYAVDGGALNNEPFDLAHEVLAGRGGSNPRSGDQAHRAIILVDPFSDTREGEPPLSNALSQIPVQLMGAFLGQSRFKQLDLSLAEAGDVYSRFLVAPSRWPQRGRRALASGELGAFMGFFHRDYRLHDFLLGRYNCHYFLRNWFCLPASNPLFVHPPGERFQSGLFPDHYQIVPVLGPAPPLPRWPGDAMQSYAEIAAPLEARVDALYPALREQLFDTMALSSWQRWAARSYLWPLWRAVLRPQLQQRLQQALEQALQRLRERQS